MRGGGVLFGLLVAAYVAGCARSEPAASFALVPVSGLIESDSLVSDQSLGAAATSQPVLPPSVRLKQGYRKVGKPYVIKGRTYFPRKDPKYTEVGMASWYGTQFHGKTTANGEVFDMNLLSAAHRTLPLPSLVRVTNLANNRSIVVRVNDRGPYSRNRIIDLSRKTAEVLGFKRQGTARVRVTYVGAAKLDPIHGTQGEIVSAEARKPLERAIASRWNSKVIPVAATVVTSPDPAQPGARAPQRSARAVVDPHTRMSLR